MFLQSCPIPGKGGSVANFIDPDAWVLLAKFNSDFQSEPGGSRLQWRKEKPALRGMAQRKHGTSDLALLNRVVGDSFPGPVEFPPLRGQLGSRLHPG